MARKVYQEPDGKMNLFLRSAVAAVFIAAAVQSFTIGVLADFLPREVCRPDVRTVWSREFDGVSRFVLSNANGAVRVAVHDAPRVAVNATVSAYVRSYVDREVAERYVKELFRADADGNTLWLVTEPRARPSEVELNVAYEILAPRGAHVEIETTRGNIYVGEGCGDVNVRSALSDIEIRKAGGIVHAQTTSGRIDLLDAGREATLRTVNGNVRAIFSGHVLTANTVNGNIDVRLPEPGVRGCDLTTTNGNITLSLHPGCSAEVNAITRQGVVKSDFEVVPLSGGQKPTELRGFIGQSETQLTLSTFAGDILIGRSET
ncbi:MAG TPA: hypothetical protein PKI11_15090 [Candidatus Hydrogenedentes bacterium]|nr:hypothetical protein [Candidatus Hydrogenedentota bacterium]HNT86723.1 hypothetical protein [Candidatus Hydrogenedentota bacterium]